MVTINPRGEIIVPVQGFIGVLTSNPAIISETRQLIESVHGPIDLVSDLFSFSVTDYYDAEMGSNLLRAFLCLETLIDPGNLVRLKYFCTEIEERFKQNGRRIINLDPGYMDYHKIVLASFKYGGFKIYLSEGVYGDMTLYYSKGRFFPFDWGFPDFRQGLYDRFLLRVRQLYKDKLKRKKNAAE
jgi:hypothetical protein